MTDISGNIHSFETFGTVDGPGIRFVVFMQGCPMRCKYCHNPDTWDINTNKEINAEEILQKYESVKEFCRGGITVTGGEPLIQIDFVTELFKNAKSKNIHTALDTSGIVFTQENTKKFDFLIKYTDLILLDIKHINDNEHKKLTGFSNKNVLAFAKYLSNNGIPVWIRHVLVPEITFNKEYLRELGRFLKTLKNIKALDVLPYHTMGEKKYDELKIEYPLKGVPALTKEQAIEGRSYILEGLKQENEKRVLLNGNR